MPPPVLCTLDLPDPFNAMLEAVADLRSLGRIPPPEELRAELSAHPVDVLCPQIHDPIDDELLALATPRLRAVCLYGAGYNNVDVAAATRRGVVIGNVPSALTEATADLTWALLLATARRLIEGDALVRAGEFDGWAPDLLLGYDVSDTVMGIVGFGRIGQAVARRALGFGMRVIYAQRSTTAPPADLDGKVTAVPLEELLSEADFVSMHVPLTEDTHHLIDEGALRRMKRSAILINTARGPVVDEAALVRALSEGWIAAAGLDVYENEPRLAPGLKECRNAVLAPHVGSATARTRSAMAELCARNTLRVLEGKLPVHCVNPDAWDGKTLEPLIPLSDST